ncbi:protein YhfH [Aneurinibacillus sp. Ricciae_BoGa-3]|nr:protein YhfH [Aneurinibacillus sp. Ricciae_BoGa-3]WCK55923.1 protein YhfH [Aneurinibacillus sp. Ricciae_BoGa-3]
MKPVSEFYNNLPKKQCANCGTVMDEQAESYKTQCPQCEGKDNYPA